MSLPGRPDCRGRARRRACRALERRFPGLQVIQGDALEVGTVLRNAPGPPPLSAVVVSGLPMRAIPSNAAGRCYSGRVRGHAAGRRHHPIHLWLASAGRSGRVDKAGAGSDIRWTRMAEFPADGDLGATACLGNILLCDDDDLGYQASRSQFTPGAGFALDETYRLAHLPLVGAASSEGDCHPAGYVLRHGLPFQGRIPRPARAGYGSFRSKPELKATPLAGKIAWGVVERRRGSCMRRSADRRRPSTVRRWRDRPDLGRASRAVLGQRQSWPSLFRVYPEKRDGINLFKRVQRLVGCRETGLYLVGMYNFIDDLDAHEAAALVALIDRWWDGPSCGGRPMRFGCWRPGTTSCSSAPSTKRSRFAARM